MKWNLILVLFALTMCASCSAGDEFNLQDLQQKALRGDADAAHQVAVYYITRAPETFGKDFWVYRLGEIGDDSDKIFAAKFLYGEDIEGCNAARKLLSSIQDRAKNRLQIEEIEADISVYDRENEAVRRARVAIRRKAHGLVDEDASSKPSTEADQKPAQGANGSK